MLQKYDGLCYDAYMVVYTSSGDEIEVDVPQPTPCWDLLCIMLRAKLRACR